MSSFQVRIEDLAIGSVCIDGTAFEHDVVVDGDTVAKRRAPKRTNAILHVTC